MRILTLLKNILKCTRQLNENYRSLVKNNQINMWQRIVCGNLSKSHLSLHYLQINFKQIRVGINSGCWIYIWIIHVKWQANYKLHIWNECWYFSQITVPSPKETTGRSTKIDRDLLWRWLSKLLIFAFFPKLKHSRASLCSSTAKLAGGQPQGSSSIISVKGSTSFASASQRFIMRRTAGSINLKTWIIMDGEINSTIRLRSSLKATPNLECR